MTAYRAAPHAAEDDAEGRWVGALPDGPISRLVGVGPLVLDMLAEAPAAATPAQLSARLVELVPDAPADAEAIVAAFCEQLVGIGVARRADRVP